MRSGRSPVHAFEGDDFADDLPPDPGAFGQALPDHDRGVPDAHPDRVPAQPNPRVNRGEYFWKIRFRGSPI